ncbi:hypothetical protein [Streptomyces sp. NPDC048242]|uniref:hypothetical protein n=1 Tax=Streptomyces sp. NPDC048242 TaxID=3155026 RepID=UPI00342E1FB0
MRIAIIGGGATAAESRLCGLGVTAVLPGFLVFGKLPAPGGEIADPLLTTAANGICCFAHESEEVLRSSLDEPHQLEDAEAAFDLVDAR